MEAGRCTLSWAGTGKQFEGLSPLGPTFLKKPWKNWPGTRSQGAKGSYQLGRIQVLLPPESYYPGLLAATTPEPRLKP